MIKKITIVAGKEGKKIFPDDFLRQEIFNSDCTLDVSLIFTKNQKLEYLVAEIELNELPEFWRGSDYSWQKIETPFLSSNYHSSKILKFGNGQYLVGTRTMGCWEWDSNSSKLRWFLVHPDLNPTFKFNSNDIREWITESELEKDQEIELGFYFGIGPVPEFARTPIGFVPTVTFTDHCDFDESQLLKTQRKFLKSAGIRITKGFFTYTYSHRGDFTAMDQEGMQEEYRLWENDGHELAYHGLSRSFGKNSWEEFRNLSSPVGFNKVSTYIDHGFLEYNFTKIPTTESQVWFRKMEEKGIDLIWNYIDIVEANALSNNQLIPGTSSIEAINKCANHHFKNNLPLDKSRDLKTWLAYGTSESLNNSIKNLSGYANRGSGNPIKFTDFLINLTRTIFYSLDPEIWRKNIFEIAKPFSFNRFSPVIFKAVNQINSNIYSFQTISVKDLETVFSRISIDKLCRESGLMIAHTYFAFLGKNHPGRFFLDETGSLNPGPEQNLRYLGELISFEKIWNPTVNELTVYHRKLMDLTFFTDNGKLHIKNAPGPVRFID